MANVVAGLVSTIIPVFNRPTFVREAVDSVLRQTYRPIEVIVVDDGSTDGTSSVLDDLAARHAGEVAVVRRPHNGPGPGPAREMGRQIARGEFIQYLDSDDLLWPRKFEVQVATLRGRPECGVAYCWTRYCPADAEPETVPFKWTGRQFDTLFPSLLVDRWWCTNTPLYRRSVCDAAGPWSNIRWGQDWAYDARVAAQGVKLAYSPEFLADWRGHHGVRQTTSADQYTYERLREYQRLQNVLFDCAIEANVEPGPEMLHFSRVMFMLARGFGALGASQEADECFTLARRSAGVRLGNSWEYRFWSAAVGVVGWRTAGAVGRSLDRVRQGRKGKYSQDWSWSR